MRFSGFAILCILAFYIARQLNFFLNVNYIKSLKEAADWLKLFLEQFYNLISQGLPRRHTMLFKRRYDVVRCRRTSCVYRVSLSDRNIVITRIYVQIMKIKRELHTTKHETTNGLLVILGDLHFPIIPQYNTLTVQYRSILLKDTLKAYFWWRNTLFCTTTLIYDFLWK